MPDIRRTTDDYLNMMRHALGKTPQSTGSKAHLLIHDLNDAGRALVNSYAWSWRTRNNVALNLIADQKFVVLPDDFGQIIDIYAENAQTYVVHQTSLADINRMRAWGQYDARNLYIAFEDAYEASNDSDGVLQNRAEIYPTPSSDRSDITISYRSKWVDMSSSDPDRVPLIPRDWERSLVLFARSFAVDIENQISPYENEALFGPSGEIARLIVEDAGRQTNHGRPLANVLANGRASLYPHRRISR